MSDGMSARVTDHAGSETHNRPLTLGVSLIYGPRVTADVDRVRVVCHCDKWHVD